MTDPADLPPLRTRRPPRFQRLRGKAWFIRNYGLREYVRYQRARRSGVTIDYAKIFTPDELAILEEHGLSMWGKPVDQDGNRR